MENKYKSESEYFLSEEFAAKIEESIIRETWANNRPRVYISEG